MAVAARIRAGRGGARRRRLASAVVVAVVAALGIGSGALAAAGPAGAAPAAGKPTSAPSRPVCAEANRPGQLRCLSLIRTDIAARPHGAVPNDTPDGYGPADLQDAYDLPSATAGSGQTVAIVDAFDNPDAEADLAVYRSQYGLPACTTANGCFKKVNQNGDEGPYPNPDPGWAGEIALDIDMVSATCPDCKILLVEADDNFTDNLAAAVDTAVALGAKYVSNSYGGDEDPSQTDFDDSYNHPGVAVTASTGDFGFGVEYPSSAPGVTAIGGTSLTADSSARGWSETAWDGAGGGCSLFTPKPSFQHDPDCANKTESDVSAVADPATGVAVYNAFSDGGWVVYGGTSVSSPIIASVYALGGTPVAGSNPEGYPYAAPAGSINDITSGSTGSCGGSYLCEAMPGYDGPTGLGTPNGVNAFRSGPHGTIRGTVTSTGSGDPISGATVTAGQNSATTARNGTYRLSVPTGRYRVIASAYGYATSAAASVTVNNNRTVTQSFALDPVPSRTVTGKVTDGSGHRWPLYAKITVAGVPGAPIYTDPFTGAYKLTLPSGTTYRLSVAPVYAGYQTKAVQLAVGGSNITKNIVVPVDASSCTAAGYATQYSGLVEHFDTTSKPAGWTVTDNADSGGVWEFDDPAQRGNLTGGTGNFAIVDSDFLGSDSTQDTELITPSVDLSGDAHPVVGLNSFYRPFLNSSIAIDYSVNGGAWHNVYALTTESQAGPLEFPLPLAANKANVKVRFHYIGDFDYYWQVDDVYVGHKACVPVKGGIVAGFVRDDNTNKPVNGALVSRAGSSDSAVTTATPDDPNLSDGFYHLVTTAVGVQRITATKSSYAADRESTTVAGNAVTRQDFRLRAGRLSVTGASIERTVTLGGSSTAGLTLRNTGTVPLTVDLGEKPGTFQIAGQPARASYAGVRGAPVRRISGHFSPHRFHADTKPGTAKGTVDPADDPWVPVTDYPTAISDNTASAQNGLIYSVAGIDASGAEVASLYSYDPTTMAWTQLADMADTREAPTSAWVDGQLYVVGGWDGEGNPLATTQAYDPGSDSWSTVADNPKPYAASGSAVLNGKLYVVGGCDSSSCGTSDVEVYDPASNSWADGPAYPEATSWIACGTIGSTVYCAGGTNDSSSSTSTYAFDGSAWTQVADMPEDDWAAASSVANGQLIVAGGAIENSTTLTNEGWTYDPTSDSWTALPNSNGSVYRLGGACGFYKVGGSIGNFQSQSDVELLPGYDQCSSGGADVTWLNESPKSLTLRPGASAHVSITLRSARLQQPGTYTAQLTFKTDTPYQVTPADITFVVNPPATWGKVYGTVSGRSCAGTTAPLAGATVQIEGFGGKHTLVTGADGTYALWLDQRSNPLTLIAAKDGWAPQTRRSAVAPGTPKRESFVLRPSKACT